MSLSALWEWLQNTELSFQIGATYWFPLLESIHVLGIVFLLGSILIVDLRLIGWHAKTQRIAIMSRELSPWSWGSFCVCIVTGAGLFISRPGAYADNTAFQTKLVLIVLAGVNLLLFTRFKAKTSSHWDEMTQPPFTIRAAGFGSLILWAGVVIAGRWVGHSM
jgi:hypothetical protein